MKRLACLIVLAVSATFAGAAPFAYATNYQQQLMMIDAQSPATVMIGNIGFLAKGLAATSSGQLYATNNAGNLFNVTGAIVTPVAPLGALNVGSMDSAGSTLWGYDENSQRLFEYDPVATSFVQWSPVVGLIGMGALSIDSGNNFLFVLNNGGTRTFGKINSATWSVTIINPNMAVSDDVEAMDFLADGNLYAAVLGDDRYKIDPLTGNVISGFFSGVHRDWADMTSVPVPEPATLSLLGAGAALLLKKRRKSRS